MVQPRGAVGRYAQRKQCRAEISVEMTAREIAEAQRQARAWLGDRDQRHAA